MSQVNEQAFAPQHLYIMNKIITHVKQTPELTLRHHPLDPFSLRLLAFSDSSFASNPDLSTQLGYIAIMTDQTVKANVLHYTSYKSRRIVRSVLRG